ncbi:zinc ABC transporter substrate-binding protein AztC [Arvimicrobium flavum]|uniref:zinc ABC transporter substrate-binding protein AztC n=1 Tax=Arvimicrobium flavum TaxID=3393320 RepID=UPI00237B15E9|nr:zinc ABC transporter substrate-binding protein AztC [Mesorhizobium shangrilense]
MLKTIRTALFSSAVLLSPAALAGASAEPLKVVASFSILADFAKNVGGDRVEITTLVGPDGDAHVYEPKPADAAAVASADVVLVNGLQFEGFVPRLVEASGAKAPLVELSKGADLLPASGGHEDEAGAAHDHGSEADHDHGAHDPHAWQSVRNAKVYVTNVADAFCTADADGCDTYRANASAYGQKLDVLEAEITAAVAAIPEAKRTIITSHDAFGYLAHAYGLNFVAPKGVSTEAEASAADVAALIRQVREDRASAVFVENITNPRLIEQIATETGLEIGGALYSDALSPEGGPAATYIDMMRHNLATIKGAVTGS